MKMRTAIKGVKDRPREWKDDQYFVEGVFGDGSEFSVCIKGRDKAEGKVGELAALIGKDDDYEVTERPDFKGVKQWKLISWPGKPERPPFSGGGGRPMGPPRFRDTEQAFQMEQTGIHRSVALREAISYATSGGGPYSTEDVLKIADSFARWLGAVQGEESAFAKYVRAISDAVKAKDDERLAKLRQMVVDSHAKGSLSEKDVDQLGTIFSANKAPRSEWAGEHDRMVTKAQTDQRRLPDPMAELEARF